MRQVSGKFSHTDNSNSMSVRWGKTIFSTHDVILTSFSTAKSGQKNTLWYISDHLTSGIIDQITRIITKVITLWL